LYDITSKLFSQEHEADMLLAQRQAYGDDFVDSNIVNARAHLVDVLRQLLEHACSHAIKFIDEHDVDLGGVVIARVATQVVLSRVERFGIVDVSLRPAMGHALSLYVALQKVSVLEKNRDIRGFAGPLNALREAFRRGDGSWKAWALQMLSKNDIGYGIKLRERVVG
jgi:hypothetical protein